MMSVSKTLLSATAVTMMFGLTACGGNTAEEKTAAPAESAEGAKVIRIATEGAYPPFNFQNADGTLGGFDVDVANALCAQMQAECEVIAQDWDGIIPGLLAEKYDAIIAGMSITPERQEKVDFTEPYFANTMVWIAGKDSGFNPAEIKDKTLGGQRSTTMGQLLVDDYEGKDGNKVNLYDSYDNAYLDLSSGRTDAVLTEKVTGQEWLKDNADYAVMGDEMDNGDNIAIAVRKDDALLGELNTAMEAIRENGELAKLEEQHFGQ